MRDVIQGAGGGSGYDHYWAAVRRDLELREEMDRAKTAISVLTQLVTLFTLTTSSNPSYAANLARLQTAVTDKQKELDDMVFNCTIHIYIYYLHF